MKLDERRVELLFEIGCEEIPAGMLPKAEEELRANVEKLLVAERLFHDVTVETFGAPRPLTAWVRGLPEKQGDVGDEGLGPPKTLVAECGVAPTRTASGVSVNARVRPCN